MNNLFINRISPAKQFAYSVLLVAVISVICYVFAAYLDYHVVAFILMVVVSLIAMFFDILPVVLSAVLTALTWDFFFIPPYFTVRVEKTEDRILLLTYLLIAIINAVLTYKIRQFEKIARQRREKASTVTLYKTLLNSLSHELRTPIATIIGATDNLQHNNVRLTPQNRADLINEISKASFRLNQQVENLLNMSRLESGLLQPRTDWCDITELVYEVVNRIDDNKVTQTVTVNINPELPLFMVDKLMLEQVVYNLVSNATIYTPADSTITISAQDYTDLLCLVIEDNGSGFPADEIGRVFDKFYRLKNARAGGTGLGLSIVKGYVEAMGGNVILENQPTGGAKFTLNIPAATSYLKNLKNE